MSVEFFLDSNVLIYAISVDAKVAGKRKRAMEIIAAGRFGLSAQVLQEFFVVVTRKIAVPMPPAKARDWLQQLDGFPCLALDRNVVKLGIRAFDALSNFVLGWSHHRRRRDDGRKDTVHRGSK